MKSKLVNPVTPEDCKKFEKFVDKWQAKLNLMDWRIVRSRRRTNNMAEVLIHIEDRLAVYKVGKSFGSMAVTDATLEATAAHEVFHIFLAEYKKIIKDGGLDEQIMSQEHRIVNTLEQVLIPKEDTDERNDG